MIEGVAGRPCLCFLFASCCGGELWSLDEVVVTSSPMCGSSLDGHQQERHQAGAEASGSPERTTRVEPESVCCSTLVGHLIGRGWSGRRRDDTRVIHKGCPTRVDQSGLTEGSSVPGNYSVPRSLSSGWFFSDETKF